MNIVELLETNGGVVHRSTILDTGFTSYQLGRAVHSGKIVRIRQAWYASPDAHPTIVKAVRVGGAVTAVSAAPFHGLWALDDDTIHVALPANGGRLRSPETRNLALRQVPDAPVCLHWRDQPGMRTNIVEPVVASLGDALECQPEERAVAMLDSALNKGLVSKVQLASLSAALPVRCQRAIERSDSRSESGTETFVRLRLRRLRLRLKVQVYREGVGRVDLLVGDRLVIECDSRSFHTGERNYQRDRHRDLELIDGNYLVLRLTYEQIVYEWDRVEAVILGLVRKERHRWPRVSTPSEFR